ncbi:RecB family exonuclease [Amycolatopsis anabasis]|uniref:RecB family exonuclease n=1 Tax=Amycolatopsis anabasis TaxID=1840409 RepID=UPI001C554625|nr:PD-(D/E)XK nuclease family protein [Amycolatopsis anabasis]
MSQYKEYKDCPYRYYLNRRERAWQRPAAWLPQGTAVHKAAEEWERSGRAMSLADAQDVFRETYAASVNEMCEDTPNLDFWYRSGPYRGEVDIERRYGLGLGQVEKYIEYYTVKAPDEVIWITPDGEPAIELEFDIDLDGVRVKGFIDQVVDGKPRDIKTGNKPGDDFQLGVYGVALEVEHGLKPTEGDYWMGRSGKPTVPYDISEWTRERVTEEFHRLDENIQAERFDAKPEPSKCGFCSVATACPFAAL